MRRGLTGTAALIVTLMLALVGAGCGDDDDDGQNAETSQTETAQTETTAQAEKGTYTGKVEGSEAYIALVSDGESVAGYICDAKQISTWIAEAKLEDGSAKLTSRKGDELGEATLAGKKASGNVIIDDKSHDFSADLASGEAGLYYGLKGEVGQAGSAESGLIVLADGSQRGSTAIIRKVMAEPMIMPSPMIMADPMGQVSLNLGSTGNLQLQQVNSITTIAVTP